MPVISWTFCGGT